jgi:hypothetical protein
MAGTTVLGLNTANTEEATGKLRLEFNRLVDDLETVRAALATLATKLNADAGVTDTNYAAPAAAALTGAKVADQLGNTTK